MKNAYILVTDLHLFDKNLRNRINYQKELNYCLNEIIKVCKKYKDLGYSLKIIFLGDIFHRSYNDVFKAVAHNNFFVSLSKVTSGMYTVVGNHEYSYYSSNPFFTLVCDIDSDSVRNTKSVSHVPVGATNVIQIVDVLQDGDVTFYFNHFGNAIQKPYTDGINIGLFHQEIVCKEIVESAENQLGGNVFAKTQDIEGIKELRGYNYCYFGHMHKIYGTWKTSDDCYFCYLASLGRTNVTEVNDNFLERNLPAILVVDGKLTDIVDNTFILPNRAACVNEVNVLNSKETYLESKERSEAKSYVPLDDDPVQSLLDRYDGNSYCTEIIQGLLNSDLDNIGFAIKHSLEKIGVSFNLE